MARNEEAFQAAFAALQEHYANDLSKMHMRQMFQEDPDRFAKMHLQHEDILFDFSKNIATERTLELLMDLVKAADVPGWTQRMWSGEPINLTEGRAVLHVALRHPEGLGHPEVLEVRRRMAAFVDRVRSGEWKGHTGKPILHIVNIGIGGSDLGPRMVCDALKPYQTEVAGRRLRGHFVSNVDGSHLAEVLQEVDRETTLFIVSSKSFTTQETLVNADSAKAWLLAGEGVGEGDVAKHFVAVSTNQEAVAAFGIDAENSMFPFWDWVGGRYSLWSAIGVSIALLLGNEHFDGLLEGAHAVDEAFRGAMREAEGPEGAAALGGNVSVVMAALGFLYNNVAGAESHCILPYDQYLHRFPAYFQQGDMESNGKGVTREGAASQMQTGPVVWGEPGTNGQHAFYQLIHQGTKLIPCDFLAAVHSHNPLHEGFARHDHHRILLSNFFAQTEALMRGKTPAEARAELEASGSLSPADVDRLLPHKVFPGNKPSNSFLYRSLTPRTLGSLIALYEHKIFVQGVLWNVNSYDQWGVELGKQLAKSILPELSPDASAVSSHDSSTNGLINYYLRCASL